MPAYFVTKAKRGRKAGKDSAKEYGKALDKPKVVASTPLASPLSSPEHNELTKPIAKKAKKQLSPVMPKDKKVVVKTKPKRSGFAARK
jgi:hypothetical protein